MYLNEMVVKPNQNLWEQYCSSFGSLFLLVAFYNKALAYEFFITVICPFYFIIDAQWIGTPVLNRMGDHTSY